VPIWVDAACINQHDDLEKSSQVAQMGNIYSMAEKTIIFLGPASETSSKTMDFFNAMGERAVNAKVFFEGVTDTALFDDYKSIYSYEHIPRRFGLRLALWGIWGSPRRKAYHRKLKKIIGSAPKNDLPVISLEQIISLMDQQWWTRVWVLQELLLSRSPWFVYGDKIVEAERVIASCVFLDKVVYYIHTFDQTKITFPTLYGLEHVCHEAEAYQFTPPAVHLFHMQHSENTEPEEWQIGIILGLAKFSTRKSLLTSNPLDQIYGVLGIVKSWPQNRKPVIPDYSLGYSEVFTKVTLTLLETASDKLDCLLQLSALPKALVDLPSWVPDWSTGGAGNRGFYSYGSFQFFDEVQRTIPYKMTADGRHLLDISGYAYGSIETFEVLEQDPIDYERIFGMDDNELLSFITDRLAPLNHKITESIVSHDTTGWCVQDASIAIALLLEHAYTRRSYLEEGRNMLTELMREPFRQNINERAKACARIMNSRERKHFRGKPARKHLLEIAGCFTEKSLENTIFVVENKYIGLTQSTIRKGDILVRFDIGSKAHFIVRSVGDGTYTLVAEAAVPRLWREPAVEGQRTDFTLC
jgi:hypothetical protein